MTRLEEMKRLATEEAINLKSHATKEERDRLDFETLLPSFSDSCIYGQMTGYCSGERAMELISLCCKRIYNVEEVGDASEGVLNGEIPKINGPDPRHCFYQSPIEVLIYDENGGEEAQKKIIAFLKDETKTLEL